jgi:hypothetical protein
MALPADTLLMLLLLLLLCCCCCWLLSVMNPQAQLSKRSAICSTGLLFNERSRTKSYSCQLSDPGIATVVGPVLPIICNTTGQAGGPAGGRTPSSALAGESWLSQPARAAAD